MQLTFLHGHANIGYGAAHNLVLHGSGADYHLVLNPDVELAPDALAVGVRWLAEHTDVGAIAPEVFDGDGERQEYLCRRFPAVFDLLLRGFMPGFVRALFRRRLERYEMRDVIDPDPEREIIDIPGDVGRVPARAARGDRCDRRLRSEVLPLLRGLRLDGTAEPHHADGVPAVDAGRATTAAARHARACVHIGWFIRSGLRFYSKHGWRVVGLGAIDAPSRMRSAASACWASSGFIVVTGASGFIGTRAVRAPARRASFRSSARCDRCRRGWRRTSQPIGDLAQLDDAALEDVVGGADAVVHLAGRAHVMVEADRNPARATPRRTSI